MSQNWNMAPRPGDVLRRNESNRTFAHMREGEQIGSYDASTFKVPQDVEDVRQILEDSTGLRVVWTSAGFEFGEPTISKPA